MEFTHKKGDTYVVIGYLFQSLEKFRLTYSNPYMALGINLWKGNIWQVRDGKRKLLKRVRP